MFMVLLVALCYLTADEIANNQMLPKEHKPKTVVVKASEQDGFLDALASGKLYRIKNTQYYACERVVAEKFNLTIIEPWK
jgi:hypothetical protein